MSDIGNSSSAAFGDLDGDGDFDLLSGSYGGGSFFYIKNEGTTQVPAFPNAQMNPFSLPSIGNFSKPALVDLDGDGDLDILSGTQNGGFNYFKNEGTSNAPIFAAVQTNPFSLANSGSEAMPSFGDLDGDGDQDLISGDPTGNFRYYQNVGTATSPAFAPVQINPFSLANIVGYSAPVLEDIDKDGDLDLLSGSALGHFYYFKNTGSATAPAFSTSVLNPFSLSQAGTGPTPAMADLDGDGKKDLMVGETYGNFYYYKNTSITGIFETSQKIGFTIYQNPSQGHYTLSSTWPNNESLELKILNTSGQVVLNSILSVGSPSFDISDQPAGIYFVLLSYGTGYSAQKIVIE